MIQKPLMEIFNLPPNTSLSETDHSPWKLGTSRFLKAFSPADLTSKNSRSDLALRRQSPVIIKRTKQNSYLMKEDTKTENSKTRRMYQLILDYYVINPFSSFVRF